MLVKKIRYSSKFLDKAPNIRDSEIQLRLNKLSEKNEFFNRGENSNFSPPNPPPPPLDPPPPPPPSDLFNIPNVPRFDEFPNKNNFNFDFSNSYIIYHQHSIHHCLGELREIFFPNRLSTAKTLSNMGTNTTQTMSGDCLIGELERVIKKEKPKEEIVPDENIIFTLLKAPSIPDDDFETKQEIKKTKR